MGHYNGLKSVLHCMLFGGVVKRTLFHFIKCKRMTDLFLPKAYAAFRPCRKNNLHS